MSQIQTVYTPNNGFSKTVQFTDLNGEVVIIQATMESLGNAGGIGGQQQKGLYVQRTIYNSNGKSTENVLTSELLKGSVTMKALKTENAIDAFIWSLIP